MHANDVRRTFLQFFEQRGHTVVPSASLIPHDPSLLFTVAGMVPFKPYFVGDETPPFRRAASVQKCVRAGGKHNDLDEIGRSLRHLTFFEMLGNFSFGDYFKADAIPWAWELVTEVLGLDAARLWVTVHVSDDEAAEIWHDVVGVPLDRIQRLDDDNFWRMAETGPCGPCSEIFWDNGAAYGADGGPAHGDDRRFVEIWNLVFMQFEERAGGERTELPKPSIDTGAGLDRLLAVLQGVDSVYETDEFARLLDTASSVTGVGYHADERSDISLRILAEHARAMTMLVSDGVVPSNEERGYVLRRIIRRAVRHAFLLGVDRLVLPRMVDAVVEVMGADYPELVTGHDAVGEVIEREEEGFRRTLASGAAILDEALEGVRAGNQLSGSVAFVLHDTYGFPVEVTQEVCAERGVDVDLEAFASEMADQRARAKADHLARRGDAEDTTPFQEVLEAHGTTDFVGRAESTTTATVLAVIGDALVLDRTPFYAESGGQIGDTGTITSESGTAKVIDTVAAIPGVFRHRLGEVTGRIEAGQTVTASIDLERRDAIRRNHTGTHVLHWALREVLGDAVRQQGSWVGPDRLRFDFNHHRALRPDELEAIEDLANAEILTNAGVRHYETTKEHAAELGAIAFFGDKYGDIVRVLEAGAHSIELCGGTHVRALGDIGLLKIVREESIGSNLRRIEAVTGVAPVLKLRDVELRLAEAAEVLGVSADDVVDGARRRLAETKALRDELRQLRQEVAHARAADLVGAAIDGVVVARIDGAPRDDLRDLATALRDRPGVRAVVLGGAPDGGGAALVAAVRPDSGFHAAELVAAGAKAIKGGGGRDPLVAAAGGKDPGGLDTALDLARAAAGIG